jgi:hypothetical protein
VTRRARTEALSQLDSIQPASQRAASYFGPLRTMIRELPGVGHGACFVDPAFRAAALDFLSRRITVR